MKSVIPLCYDKLAKRIDEPPAKNPGGFSYALKEAKRDAKESAKAMQVPRLREADGRKVLPEHEHVARQHYERFARGYDTHDRYGRAWQRIRDRYIASHPLCEKCAEAGRYVKAVLVHHLRPIADGGANDAENLMSLCVSCHEKMHRRGRNA